MSKKVLAVLGLSLATLAACSSAAPSTTDENSSDAMMKDEDAVMQDEDAMMKDDSSSEEVMMEDEGADVMEKDAQ